MANLFRTQKEKRKEEKEYTEKTGLKTNSLVNDCLICCDVDCSDTPSLRQSLQNQMGHLNIDKAKKPLKFEDSLVKGKDISSGEYVPDSQATSINIKYRAKVSTLADGNYGSPFLSALTIDLVDIKEQSAFSGQEGERIISSGYGSVQKWHGENLQRREIHISEEKADTKDIKSDTRKYAADIRGAHLETGLPLNDTDAEEAKLVYDTHKMLERYGLFDALKTPSHDYTRDELMNIQYEMNLVMDHVIKRIREEYIDPVQTNEEGNKVNTSELGGAATNSTSFEQIIEKIGSEQETQRLISLCNANVSLQNVHAAQGAYVFLNDTPNSHGFDVHGIKDSDLAAYCLGAYRYPKLAKEHSEIGAYVSRLTGIPIPKCYAQYMNQYTNTNYVVQKITLEEWEASRKNLESHMRVSPEMKSHAEAQQKDLNIQEKYYQKLSEFYSNSDNDKLLSKYSIEHSSRYAFLSETYDASTMRILSENSPQAYDCIVSEMKRLQEETAKLRANSNETQDVNEQVSKNAALYEILSELKDTHPYNPAIMTSRDDIRLLKSITQSTLLTPEESKVFESFQNTVKYSSLSECFKHVTNFKEKEDMMVKLDAATANLIKVAQAAQVDIETLNKQVINRTLDKEALEQRIKEIEKAAGKDEGLAVSPIVESYKNAVYNLAAYNTAESIVEINRINFGPQDKGLKYPLNGEFTSSTYPSKETVDKLLSSGALDKFTWNPSLKKVEVERITDSAQTRNGVRAFVPRAQQEALIRNKIIELSNPQKLAEQVIYLRELRAAQNDARLEHGVSLTAPLTPEERKVNDALSIYEGALHDYMKARHPYATFADGKAVAPAQEFVDRVNLRTKEYMENSSILKQLDEKIKDEKYETFRSVLVGEEAKYPLNTDKIKLLSENELVANLKEENLRRVISICAKNSTVSSDSQDLVISSVGKPHFEVMLHASANENVSDEQLKSLNERYERIFELHAKVVEMNNEPEDKRDNEELLKVQAELAKELNVSEHTDISSYNLIISNEINLTAKNLQYEENQAMVKDLVDGKITISDMGHNLRNLERQSPVIFIDSQRAFLMSEAQSSGYDINKEVREYSTATIAAYAHEADKIVDLDKEGIRSALASDYEKKEMQALYENDENRYNKLSSEELIMTNALNNRFTPEAEVFDDMDILMKVKLTDKIDELSSQLSSVLPEELAKTHDKILLSTLAQQNDEDEKLAKLCKNMTLEDGSTVYDKVMEIRDMRSVMTIAEFENGAKESITKNAQTDEIKTATIVVENKALNDAAQDAINHALVSVMEYDKKVGSINEHLPSLQDIVEYNDKERQLQETLNRTVLMKEAIEEMRTLSPDAYDKLHPALLHYELLETENKQALEALQSERNDAVKQMVSHGLTEKEIEIAASENAKAIIIKENALGARDNSDILSAVEATTINQFGEPCETRTIFVPNQIDEFAKIETSLYMAGMSNEEITQLIAQVQERSDELLKEADSKEIAHICENFANSLDETVQSAQKERIPLSDLIHLSDESCREQVVENINLICMGSIDGSPENFDKITNPEKLVEGMASEGYLDNEKFNRLIDCLAPIAASQAKLDKGAPLTDEDKENIENYNRIVETYNIARAEYCVTVGVEHEDINKVEIPEKEEDKENDRDEIEIDNDMELA